MAEKDFIVCSPVRVRNVLYRENEPLTCDPKDLAGVEHCVKPVDKKAEAAAKAAAEAEAAAAAEAEAKAKADAEAAAKAGK